MAEISIDDPLATRAISSTEGHVDTLKDANESDTNRETAESLSTPQLKILLNKDFDKKICFDFLNTKAAGIDFGGGIIQIHPHLSEALKMDELSAKDLISKYFDQFYLEHQDELAQVRKEAENVWIKKQESFFKACNVYFENHPWPEGKYEAYQSIINCNPRSLEDKTFQFYWQHPQGFSSVAAHEMLHFLFFDLAKKIIPGINPEDQKLWAISEVFNGLIMEEAEFTQIIGNQRPEQYPDLVRTQAELREVWNKNKKAKNFILSTLSS